MTESALLRRAVFFDRDGVLNVDRDYVYKVEDLEWMPGAKAAVARLNAAGVLVIVVTNQSGVARGYFAEADVDRFHEAMQADLAAVGARIDAFYSAPYHENAVEQRYRHPDHPDRKPNPGMVLRAIDDFGIDPARSIIIGDKPRDIAAGAAAGVPGFLYQGGDLDEFVRARLPT